MATHFSQPSHASPDERRAAPCISSPAITMLSFGQIDVQGLQGISCEQWKIGKTPSRFAGMSSVIVIAGAGLEHLGRAVPLGRHLADVAAEPPRDLEAADAPGEHRRRRLGDLLRVAGRHDRQAELLRLLEELVHRVEADRHQDRVALEALLGARDRLPVPVDLRDRDAGHLLGPVRRAEIVCDV